MERFYAKYDKERKVLIIEASNGIAFSTVSFIREHFPIEMNYASIDVIDAETENGVYYNTRKITIPVTEHKTDIFFDAAKRMYAKSIADSLPNSDN